MYYDKVWAWALALALGYLFGSCNGSLLISKGYFKTDIRKHGSGNAGLTNAARTLGPKPAVIVTLIDLAKVVPPMIAGMLLLGRPGVIPAGLGAFFGHLKPIYFGFKGGKGALSTGAIMFFIDWRIGCVYLFTFLILLFTSRYVSVGSMAAGLLSMITAWIIYYKSPEYAILVSVFALFIIYAHRGNIKRLAKGEEPKLKRRKK